MEDRTHRIESNKIIASQYNERLNLSWTSQESVLNNECKDSISTNSTVIGKRGGKSNWRGWQKRGRGGSNYNTRIGGEKIKTSQYIEVGQQSWASQECVVSKEEDECNNSVSSNSTGVGKRGGKSNCRGWRKRGRGGSNHRAEIGGEKIKTSQYNEVGQQSWASQEWVLNDECSDSISTNSSGIGIRGSKSNWRGCRKRGRGGSNHHAEIGGEKIKTSQYNEVGQQSWASQESLVSKEEDDCNNSVSSNSAGIAKRGGKSNWRGWQKRGRGGSNHLREKNGEKIKTSLHNEVGQQSWASQESVMRQEEDEYNNSVSCNSTGIGKRGGKSNWRGLRKRGRAGGLNYNIEKDGGRIKTSQYNEVGQQSWASQESLMNKEEDEYNNSVSSNSTGIGKRGGKSNWRGWRKRGRGGSNHHAEKDGEKIKTSQYIESAQEIIVIPKDQTSAFNEKNLAKENVTNKNDCTSQSNYQEADSLENITPSKDRGRGRGHMSLHANLNDNKSDNSYTTDEVFSANDTLERTKYHSAFSVNTRRGQGHFRGRGRGGKKLSINENITQEEEYTDNTNQITDDKGRYRSGTRVYNKDYNSADNKGTIEKQESYEDDCEKNSSSKDNGITNGNIGNLEGQDVNSENKTNFPKRKRNRRNRWKNKYKNNKGENSNYTNCELESKATLHCESVKESKMVEPPLLKPSDTLDTQEVSSEQCIIQNILELPALPGYQHCDTSKLKSSQNNNVVETEQQKTKISLQELFSHASTPSDTQTHLTLSTASSSATAPPVFDNVNSISVNTTSVQMLQPDDNLASRSVESSTNTSSDTLPLVMTGKADDINQHIVKKNQASSNFTSSSDATNLLKTDNKTSTKVDLVNQSISKGETPPINKARKSWASKGPVLSDSLSSLAMNKDIQTSQTAGQNSAIANKKANSDTSIDADSLSSPVKTVTVTSPHVLVSVTATPAVASASSTLKLSLSHSAHASNYLGPTVTPKLMSTELSRVSVMSVSTSISTSSQTSSASTSIQSQTSLVSNSSQQYLSPTAATSDSRNILRKSHVTSTSQKQSPNTKVLSQSPPLTAAVRPTTGVSNKDLMLASGQTIVDYYLKRNVETNQSQFKFKAHTFDEDDYDRESFNVAPTMKRATSFNYSGSPKSLTRSTTQPSIGTKYFSKTNGHYCSKLVFDINKNSKLVIKSYGNIVKEKSELLVCVLGSDVDMRKTKVGLSFHKEFPYLWEELKNCQKNNPYSKVLTVEQPLFFSGKAICHVILTPWDKERSPEQIETALQEIFKVVDDLDIQSVSIPPLGYGQAFGFPAESMVHSILNNIKLMNISKSLKKVVLFAPNVTLFEEYKEQAPKYFNESSHNWVSSGDLTEYSTLYELPKQGTLANMEYLAQQKTVYPSYWCLSKTQGTSSSTWSSLRSFVSNIFNPLAEKNSSQARLVEVDSETKEAIQKLVIETHDPNVIGQGADAVGMYYSSLEVIDIKRVENPAQFEKYHARRKEILEKMIRKGFPCQDVGKITGSKGKVLTSTLLSGPLKDGLYTEINEHYLFHGTKPSALKNITENGFDPGCSKTLSMFGQAVYAAERFTKADQYSDDKTSRKPNGTELTLILARMLLGNVFVCDENHKWLEKKVGRKFKKPPCMHCLEDVCICFQNEHYDSVMGDGKWLFREFVVYDGSQCYPEYVIKYRRLK